MALYVRLMSKLEIHEDNFSIISDQDGVSALQNFSVAK